MYARILVPLDGSPLSQLALPYAQMLAQACNAELELVFGIETKDVPETVAADIRKDGEDYLKQIAASLPEALKSQFAVQAGHPPEVILDRAEAKEGTLIVMATHGYSGMQRWFLGSVAHRVVQAAAKNPVLLIPVGAKSPEGGPVEFRRLIVPLDGSPLAEGVLPHAIFLCKALDMEMILTRAYNPTFPGSSIRMHQVSEIVHDSAEIYLKDKLDHLEKECQAKTSYEVLRGVPAQRITDFALETPNSLTALCSHGERGIGRWLLGSVTDEVIHSSEEPVLVVPASRNHD